MTSNKSEETLALFAVPLPSACSSNFLCLCKRLFWNVGSSHFSAFCPLTVEETRLLPQASAVVQLVSVTPALAADSTGRKNMSQDLLTYTMTGEIVGVPYVAISRDRNPKGKLTRALPFDELTTTAWVPAINAPFVTATCTPHGVRGGPLKDVFIIRNDEKTRQSLLKGENVVFSQQDGKSGSSKVSDESATVPSQQNSLLNPEVAQQESASQKERTQSVKVSPTSSSLYKAYNSNKRDPDGKCTSTADEKSSATTLTPAASQNREKHPAMVLPRIESVFSLAGSSLPGESLKKRIADTLSQRNAWLQQNPTPSKPSSESLITSDKNASPHPNKPSPFRHSNSEITEDSKTSSSNATSTKPELETPRANGLQGLATPPKAAGVHPVGPAQGETGQISSLGAEQQRTQTGPSPSLSGVGVHPQTSNPPAVNVNGCAPVQRPPPTFVADQHRTQNGPSSTLSGVGVHPQTSNPSAVSANGSVPLQQPPLAFGDVLTNISNVVVYQESVPKREALQRWSPLKRMSGLTVKKILETRARLSTSSQPPQWSTPSQPAAPSQVTLVTQTPRPELPSTAASLPVHSTVPVSTSHTANVSDKSQPASTQDSKYVCIQSSLSKDESKTNELVRHSRSSPPKRLPPLKVVIKTRNDGAEVVKTSSRPEKDKLVVIDGKVPFLKLSKIEISHYKLVDLATAMQGGSAQRSSIDPAKGRVLVGGEDTPEIKDRNKEAVPEINTSNELPNKAVSGVGNHCVKASSSAFDINVDDPDSQQGSASVPPPEGETTAFQTNGYRPDSRPMKKKRRRRHKKSQKSSLKLEHIGLTKLESGSKRKSDCSWNDDREHLSDCQNKLSVRSKRQRRKKSTFGFTAGSSEDSKDYFLSEDFEEVQSNSCHKVAGLQNPLNEAAQGFDISATSLNQQKAERNVDQWSELSSPTDSEWEFPEASGEAGSDWDSSLEDEISNSPVKSVTSVPSTPFGDFQHMLLQDRLRLLEQTLKEHQTALNAIKRPNKEFLDG